MPTVTTQLSLWRHWDRELLLALLIGIISAWPFWVNPSLPTATDAELHIFRIAEMGYGLQAGNLYPRWAANFYYGYGYPIFNYYAPLTYHLGNWVTLFQPERAVVGAKTLFITAALLGAIGAYLLGREFGGQAGGVLGAAAFGFAPYITLINPHVRGDLPEVFALAIVPWTLWSWERLWDSGGKGIFVTAILSAAMTLLSHNLTGLTTMLLLMALSAWYWLIKKNRERVGWAFLAGSLTMALTAFFWLPFLLERRFIHLDVVGEGHYDFRNHFVLLRDLLAFLHSIDWRAATNDPPMSVGPVLVFLAVAGFVVALVWREENHHRVYFYMLSSLLCFWLITPGSRRVWEAVPGMAYYQFPWRFLGPLAVLLVPLVASLGNIALSKKRRALVLTGVCAAIIITAMPGLYPIPWMPNFGPTDPLTLLDFELQGRWRGTTSTDDFIPTTVEVIPGPTQSLLDSYHSPPIDRVNRYTLPDGATVTVLDELPGHNRFAVQAPHEMLLRLYLFYFPGWKAYVDGQETPIEIAKPEGFITLWVPAGEHEVLLSFEDTSPRTAGWIIAGASLVILLIAIWRFPKATPESGVGRRMDNTTVRTWLAACLVCILLLKMLVFDHTEWFHYTSPPGEARAASYRQQADFGGEITLLGFDLSGESLEPGSILDVTVYWNSQRVLTNTYQSFVHVVYPEGYIWTQSDHLNPAGFPTNLWSTSRYIRDRHRLVLPPDMPNGEYSISVGIYLLSSNTRLPVLWAESGARTDNVILSETISVRR